MDLPHLKQQKKGTEQMDGMNGMNTEGLGSLDLSGVEASGPPLLDPGRHVVKVTSAKVDKVGAEKCLEIQFSNEAGGLRMRLFLWHRNEKAKEISRRQLKALCEYGGHPDPDHPNDVNLIKGLTVGILVKMGKEFTDKTTGEQRTLPEIKGFFKPDTPSYSPPTNSGSRPATSADLDDEIPF